MLVVRSDQHNYPSTISSGGVSLHVCREDEDYYIDVEPIHDPLAIAIMLLAARNTGLELMPETECQPDVLPDGTIRSYLAEVVRC